MPFVREPMESDPGSDSEGSGDESCQVVVPEPRRELESTSEQVKHVMLRAAGG